MYLRTFADFLINPLLYAWVGLLALLFSKYPEKIYFIILNVFFYTSTIAFTSYLFKKAWNVQNTFNPNKSYDAVVILSGILDFDWYIDNKNSSDNSENHHRFNDSFNRVLAGINIVKLGYAKKMLLGELIIHSVNEAQVLKDFAMQNGVKSEQIEIYGRVNQTFDPAAATKAFVEAHSLRKLVIITSGVHMRRALATFKKEGLNPEVYSVNTRKENFDWTYFIPSPRGAQSTMDSLYELLSYVWFFIKGYI
jgi:uncharacterized SAM-binding protein YcdF (DUF218 family)